MTMLSLFIQLLIVISCCESQAAASEVVLASDDWCPYICAEASKINNGFLVDVAEAAFRSQGFKTRPTLMPLARAMIETIHGRIDGIYAPEIDPRLALTKPVINSYACFYTLPNSRWTFKGASSLQSIRLAIISDYGYDDDGPMDKAIKEYKSKRKNLWQINTGVDAGTKNLKMLMLSHVDAILEHEAVMTHLAGSQQPAVKIRKAGCLERPLPLVIGFTKASRSGVSLADIFKKGLDQIKKTEEFQKLKDQYQIP